MTGVIVCPIFSGLPSSNQQLAEAGRDVTLGAKRADRSMIPSPLSRIVADASVAAPARRLDGSEGLVRDAALPESSCASPGIQANRSSDDPLRMGAGGTTCGRTGNALLGMIGSLSSTQCETSAGPGRIEIKATQMESQPWRLQRNGTNGWRSLKQRIARLRRLPKICLKYPRGACAHRFEKSGWVTFAKQGWVTLE